MESSVTVMQKNLLEPLRAVIEQYSKTDIAKTGSGVFHMENSSGSVDVSLSRADSIFSYLR